MLKLDIKFWAKHRKHCKCCLVSVQNAVVGCVLVWHSLYKMWPVLGSVAVYAEYGVVLASFGQFWSMLGSVGLTVCYMQNVGQYWQVLGSSGRCRAVLNSAVWESACMQNVGQLSYIAKCKMCVQNMGPC